MAPLRTHNGFGTYVFNFRLNYLTYTEQTLSLRVLACLAIL
jgi:hypothetical protein